jgi:hypothetical protein
MGLVISKGLTLRKGWQPMDTDAAAYITAVETADGQALEEKTKIAIDNFVLGCKAGRHLERHQGELHLGWCANSARCPDAAGRHCPTSFNFVDGDYNRKTGLVGNGSTKYLDSNRNNNADPQNSNHLSVYATTLQTAGVFGVYIGSRVEVGVSFLSTWIGRSGLSPANVIGSSRGTGVVITATGLGDGAGFIGLSRANSTNASIRAKAATQVSAESTTTPADANVYVFQRNSSDGSFQFTDARLAFYSIGESLDLALLDARVTDLINAFAIP